MTNNYDSLDLNVVKNRVAAHAAILNAKKYILDEEVIFNPLFIKRNILDTDSAMEILKDGHYLSFDGIEDPNNLVIKASKGQILMPNELNMISSFLNHSERIKKFFTQFEMDNCLRDYSDSIVVLKRIIDDIDKCIDVSGNVKDDASSELKKINFELNSVENQLAEKARKFISSNISSLQESSVYERENRVTFLIKNVDKNKYGGFVYGSSSSGLAQYVEPQIFVELNNKKQMLINDKEEEIKKILTRLTYLIDDSKDEIIRNFDSIVKINVIFSKASYGLDIDGIVGEVNSDYIELLNISHPLIDKNVVVSNSYNLTNKYNGIVISGSNTGGKTVSLKLIGLSVLLTYLGIPIHAESIKVPIFDNLYVDIDDNQSIESSLSTFSAHISNINSILNKASNKSIVLIDELISGTDPKEAQAISIAILDKILNIGCKFVITTHFDDIKKYAYDNDKILLSSVGFDLKELKPTYKYLENSVGSSNALEIASRYFDDQSIINNAKDILNNKNNESDDLLNRLAIEISKQKTLEDELNSLKDKYDSLNKSLNIKLNELDNSKNKLKADYEEKLNQELHNIIDKANSYLLEIKKTGSKELLNKIEELNDDYDEEITYEVGDNVSINGNSQFGQITNINGDDVTVNINGLIIKTKKNKISKAIINRPLVKKYQSHRQFTSLNHELNLVGKRVDEAINLLDDYLDKAYGHNYLSVRIIHGYGTGALKKAISEHLKKNNKIASYKLADFDNGGSAVTIVEFKK